MRFGETIALRHRAFLCMYREQLLSYLVNKPEILLVTKTMHEFITAHKNVCAQITQTFAPRTCKTIQQKMCLRTFPEQQKVKHFKITSIKRSLFAAILQECSSARPSTEALTRTEKRLIQATQLVHLPPCTNAHDLEKAEICAVWFPTPTMTA